MGIRSTLSSLLTAPMAQAVDDQIREVTRDLLAGADLASAADLRSIQSRVAELQESMKALKADLKSCSDAIQSMDQAADEQGADASEVALQLTTLASRLDKGDSTIANLQSSVDALTTQLGAVQAKAQATPKAPQKPPTAPQAEAPDRSRQAQEGEARQLSRQGLQGRRLHVLAPRKGVLRKTLPSVEPKEPSGLHLLRWKRVRGGRRPNMDRRREPRRPGRHLRTASATHRRESDLWQTPVGP